MDTRAKLAKLLRKPDVREDVWRFLEGNGSVGDAEAYDDMGSLVSAARLAMKYFPDSSTRRAAETHPEREVDGWRREDYYRVEALREYLSIEGDKLRAVRDFRQNVLGGRILDSSDVWQFITSPAILMFSLGELESAGVDPVGNVSEIEDESTRRGSYRATVRVTAVQKVGGFGEFESESLLAEPQSLKFRAARKDSAIYLEERVEPFPSTVWPHPGESTSRPGVEKFRYWPRSVFANLFAVTRTLRRRFAWDFADALQFVLTGEAPQMLPIETYITVSTGAPNSRINLSISPWVSSETLARHFQAVKRHRGAAKQRSVGPRNLRIFRAVTRWRADDEDATWDAMMEKWNDSNPDDIYSERRLFHRDYERAASVIMRERFGFDIADTIEAIAAVRKLIAPTYGQKNERIAKGESNE